MPTKTDRILSYLPSTFKALPRPSALHALVDAFGNELQWAENSLAAIMRAHWVDHADRGAETIDDLARLAALYGLSPRSDEGVEEFREHLKRYIRTLLEGTVTVQGILRVTAEALALHIADQHEQLDSWWQRPSDTLVTCQARGDDASSLVLGIDTVTGSPPLAARITGSIDLGEAVDLRGATTLRLKIDGGAAIDIDVTALAANPTAVSLDELVAAINDGAGVTVAYPQNPYLILESPTTGPTSRIEVEDSGNDAAAVILGLAPRHYGGGDASAAGVTGSVDLSGDIDLSGERYLRLAIDGGLLAEIDCAGADPAHTTLDEIRDNINSDLGMAVASHNGNRLTLTSPTTGIDSSIAFHQAAAQDAAQRLFGPVFSIYSGRDAYAARVTATHDLSSGVNLSKNALIQLSIDGGAAITIDCAGTDPAATSINEVATAINTATGSTVASHTVRFLTLTSPSTGAGSAIVLASPPNSDATDALFGIRPRDADGSAASTASLTDQRDLSGGIDVTGRYFLRIAIDAGTWTNIDLRTAAANPRTATPAELAAAINTGLAADIASHDGRRLTLTSPTLGAAGSVAIEPLTTVRQRRFVSRAMIIDEAAQVILGFVSRQAQGVEAARAQVEGRTDLSRGVDLRQKPYLRLGIDAQPPVDIDCRGPRPRATVIEEISSAINTALGQTVASHNGKNLTLTSPTSGAASRIVLEPPQAEDALELLLGAPTGTYRGTEASGVGFVATVDLSDGVDLSGAERIRLGIDGSPPVEISCAGADPARTSLNEIIIIINLALDEIVASHDGRYLRLTSPGSGTGSRIVFSAPGAADATAALFGITPPRTYQGVDAAPARIIGQADLSGDIDLSSRRYLRLALDGGTVLDVDCAASATDPQHTDLDEIIAAINKTLGSGIASRDGDRLVLTSGKVGTASRITATHYSAGDARTLLLDQVTDTTAGADPQPARITGEIPLLSPVDLTARRVLRLSVDDGLPTDIDVSGAVPVMTFLPDIVDAINAQFPGIAAIGEDNKLQLTSNTAGKHSRLAVSPLRYLEVVEYPPEVTEAAPQSLHHGTGWRIHNTGASDAHGEISLHAPQGVVWPALVNVTQGWQIRLLTVIQRGETAKISRDESRGLRAIIQSPAGETRPVPAADILVGPLGAQITVPQPQPSRLCRNGDGQQVLHLLNPLALHVVKLRARSELSDHSITVAIEESVPGVVEPPVADGGIAMLQGRLRQDGEEWLLMDVDDKPIVKLRPGPDVRLADFLQRVISVTGPLYPDTPPLMRVRQIAQLFDLSVRVSPPLDSIGEEHYPGVTIGVDPQRDDALVRRINAGPQSSRLIKAESLARDTGLKLLRGQNRWRYQDCHGDRFDMTLFDAAHFAAGGCRDRAIFDVSRFTPLPPERVKTVFADTENPPRPSALTTFSWIRHQPGALQVNLPADLPARFGGHFDQARFGQGHKNPELHEKAVTEPADDERFLVTLLNTRSTLVEASVTGFVPQGWQAVTLPFRKPASLTLGTDSAPARLYLSEEGLSGFIEIRAREAGAWGNEIAISARASGPAMFDVEIIYASARFENARKIAMGKDLNEPDLHLPAQTDVLMRAGPLGVLQAKAAGIHTTVSRNNTEVSLKDRNRH